MVNAQHTFIVEIVETILKCTAVVTEIIPEDEAFYFACSVSVHPFLLGQ